MASPLNSGQVSREQRVAFWCLSLQALPSLSAFLASNKLDLKQSGFCRLMIILYDYFQSRYVIWSRIDQKSCFKSILTAGLEPVVVELTKRGDELVTDLVAVREEIHRLGPDNVLAIMTCTRCIDNL